MRRLILLGSLLMLPGCQTLGSYVGNPFDGFGGFIGDTVTFHTNPNQPAADSEDMRRSMGQSVTVPPLLPEPGDVWPGPPAPEPTLEDIVRQQNTPADQSSGQPAPPAVHPQPRGSSTPPELLQPVIPSQPAPPPPAAPVSPPAPPPSTATGTVATPQGPAIITNDANGVQNYTLPDGSTGRAMQNGNGTMTLIGPNGAVQSVPAPR